MPPRGKTDGDHKFNYERRHGGITSGSQLRNSRAGKRRTESKFRPIPRKLYSSRSCGTHESQAKEKSMRSVSREPFNGLLQRRPALGFENAPQSKIANPSLQKNDSYRALPGKLQGLRRRHRRLGLSSLRRLTGLRLNRRS